MSHILIIGCGPAGISAALRLAERGQKVTLASAKPPVYHRCAGLPGIDLPEDAAQELREMGAQSLSGHEVMHAFSRKLLRFEADETIRFLPYHRLLQLAVGDGRCVGGVILNELSGTLEGISADAVLLAAGGMHTMFAENRFGCDGLAATLAFQAGAALRNPDQINTSGRYPIFEGGLVTSWDGETTVPGLYAAGECADGTALAFPFSQAMATGTAAADHLCESLPEADPLEAGCAITSAVAGVQQLLDIFRRTRGTRAPAAVERRIRETVQRTMTGGRTARLLQRGLLDIRVMRQQAGRGGYDLGEGLYLALRLPALLQLLEVMLTTAAFRLLRQDGDLTAVLRDGKIDVTAKRSAAVEAAAYMPEDLPEESVLQDSELPEGAPEQEPEKEDLIGVGSALQNAAENEFAAKYNVPRKQKKKVPAIREEALPDGETAAQETDLIAAAITESFQAESGILPDLADVAPTEDTISFQPVKLCAVEDAQPEKSASGEAPQPQPEPALSAPELPGPAGSGETAEGSVKPEIFTEQVVFDHDPLKDIKETEKSEAQPDAAKAAAAEPDVSVAEPEVPVEAPKKRDKLFTPDPEALLALATARKAKAEPEPQTGAEPVHRKAYTVFSPDPEDLLTVSQDK